MTTAFKPLALALLAGIAALPWTGMTAPADAATRVRQVQVPLHPGRNGALTEQEMAMARAAWQYFVGATQEKTGLVNSVGKYPSTTMWDTASYISALVSAEALGIIERNEFDARMLKLLGTLNTMGLFHGEMPNKVYNTLTGEKVDYANKPGDDGFSSIDVGRLLVWLAIAKERHPYLANAIDRVPLRWNFCRAMNAKGDLQGATVRSDGSTYYHQEGRLGYEEYAAKGFGLWGFYLGAAPQPQPYAIADVNGVPVPYDSRDPRFYQTMNHVVSEAYILDGIELNFDLPNDQSSDAMHFSDGWRAEFAQRVYKAQERRYELTGILTARTEHQVEGAPFFAYDTVFANGYAWNTLSPDGKYIPERAAVAAKGAIGLWALWDTPYTDKLFDLASHLYTQGGGFYEGAYENGAGAIPLTTANNNGIILAELLYKVQGPLYQKLKLGEPQVWFTEGAGTPARAAHCLPDRPLSTSAPAASIPADEFLFCDVAKPKARKEANPAAGLTAYNCDPKRVVAITYRRLPNGK